MSRRPTDHEQRLRALEPDRSFIVQAPAGSGKTGLLTQRFLSLLPRVGQPEEIIAITFTRKAAGEMRTRIIDALRGAAGEAPEPDHEKRTWELAGAAMRHAISEGWDLLDNPQRLRIQTIDSLCQHLSRRMPLGSGFGEVPAVAEDADRLYRAATESVLEELETQGAVAEALGRLLLSLDNDVAALSALIPAMLTRRDQWIRHVLGHGSRADTQAVLEAIVECHLEHLEAAWGAHQGRRLSELLVSAANPLEDDHELARFRDAKRLPGAGAADLADWRVIAGLLLTGDGAWRKTVNVRQGFPPGDDPEAKERKRRMLDLLDELRHDAPLRDLLAFVRVLPEPVYGDDEWELVEALFETLRAALVHLKVVFAEAGEADFIELALAAQAALGEDLAPTELGLMMDYRLQHLLVDEFQDTSQNQFDLFLRLTAGWMPGDGRTLFLVGDPMQSIYGFREAEVGLFLEAWKGRFGNIALEPLQLSVNFRSDEGVVEWVNGAFPRVMPESADADIGAVPFLPSDAHRGAGQNPAVTVHPFLGRDDEAEAGCVLDLIRSARTRGGTTAVLARGKAHLAAIIARLRAAGERFQAVELAALNRNPAVMDLLSLTLALMHPADRVSWLSVLRGPLVGLSMADLCALAGAHGDEQCGTVPDRLRHPTAHGAMSREGARQLERVAPVLLQAVRERGRRPLDEWVEGTWQALGGDLMTPDAASLEDVEVFVQLLQRMELRPAAVTREMLLDETARLFALPDPLADEGLQLMTIHKAKGLEFDTVIVPGLGRRLRSDADRLLYWRKARGAGGESYAIFGPVRPKGAPDASAVSSYIRDREAQSAAFEEGRLLYVAATRARRELHLLGHATERQHGDPAPDKGSLLARLWPAVSDAWAEAVPAAAGAAFDETSPPIIHRVCVPAGWSLPAPPPPREPASPPLPGATQTIAFDWAGTTARAVGTVVHRLLQAAGQKGVEVAARWFGDDDPTVHQLLRAEGLGDHLARQARDRVLQAVRRTLEDERGQWILSRDHEDARYEWPVTTLVGGRPTRMVIDRSFVDASGARWIIDYKTGVHAGGDLEAFLDQEADRYRDQLSAYSAAVRRLDQRPVRAALYFPLIDGGWRELDPD